MKFTYCFLVFVVLVATVSGQQGDRNKGQSQKKIEEGKSEVTALLKDLAVYKSKGATKEVRKTLKKIYDKSLSIGYNEGVLASAFDYGYLEFLDDNFSKAARITSNYVAAARKLKNTEAQLDGLKRLIVFYNPDYGNRPKKKKEAEESFYALHKLESERLKSVRKARSLQFENQEIKIDIIESERKSSEIAERASRLQDSLNIERIEQLEKDKAIKELEISTLKLKNESNEMALMAGKRRSTINLLSISLIAAVLSIFLLYRTFRIKRKHAKEQQKSQHQLMVQENMANLGRLTVGIAHEIKNPLNFVNNFAEGSSEIVEELEESFSALDLEEADLELPKELIADLKDNSLTINKNGKRIERIIHSMMAHAHGNKGTMVPTDINLLLKESLNLAYHGYRGTTNNFSMTIKEEYGRFEPLKVVPQTLNRAFLNIFGNAIYALNEKKERGVEDFDPTLEVTTEKREKEVVIAIRDNGPGIPEEVRKKIFTPFFSTKPVENGNIGLGLYMSYDTVVNGHRGQINMDTKEGEYTEFTIKLPA